MILGRFMRQRMPLLSQVCRFGGSKEAANSKEVEPNFLEMVESYFDKAASHTKIPADRLNLYKKSECVIKFHLTLKRGTPSHQRRQRHHRDHPGLPLPAQDP